MQRNYVYIHVQGCGGPAFYLECMPAPGMPLPGSADVELPDGTRPDGSSRRLCGSCGYPLGRLRTENVRAVQIS